MRGADDHVTRARLSADGGLVTAALVAAALGLAVVAGTGSHVSNVIVGAGVASAVVLGPLLAWRMDGRRAGLEATGGALLGYLAGGAAVVVLLLVVAGADRLATAAGVLGSAGEASRTVGLVAAGLVAAALLGVCAWTGVAAVAGLLPGRQGHARLAAGRLAAALVTAAFVALVLSRVAAGPDTGAGLDAALLMASPALVGAAVVTLADVVETRGRRPQARSELHAPPR